MDTKTRPWKLLLSGLLAGLLVMGTLAATQPAIAAAPLKWAKIWKQEIKPRADKRYYTKKKSNARYYKKAESNARYLAKPKVVRGVFALGGEAAAVGSFVVDEISFDVTFSAAPEVHVITPGGVVPSGCSGTVEAPSASPGHFCIFQEFVQNLGTMRVFDASTTVEGTASRMGAIIAANSTAGGTMQLLGSWAAGPVSISARVAVDPRQRRVPLGAND